MSATNPPPTAAALVKTDDAINNSRSMDGLKDKAVADPVVANTILSAILSVIGDRSLLETSTFWVTTLTPALTFSAGYLAKYLGAPIDGATIGLVAAVLGAIAAAVMKRWFTSPVPVTSFLPVAK